MISLYAIFVAIFAGFALIEVLRPRQTYPSARYWKTRGAIAFVGYFAIATVSPLLWDHFLAAHRLFDLSGLPFAAQAGIGLIAAQLVGYAWHRTMHATPFLWRWLHQMHHSSERIDVWSSFLFSPQDVVGFTFVGSRAPAAIAINVFAIFMSIWTHSNIRTPHWLGYVIARPESHAAHHERGVHRDNYCDLPLIDMLFGSFRNPRERIAAAGFYEGASMQIGRMLAGRNLEAEYRKTKRLDELLHVTSD